MTTMYHPDRRTSVTLIITLCLVPVLLAAQGGRGNQSANLQQASQAMRAGKTAEALAAVREELKANPTSTQAANMLDTLGATTEARAVFQKIIDAAPDPAAKAAAQRAMAMSYAFDGDCANTVKYEQMVIAYHVTREQSAPQDAFYQQGEMANEAARVCIDRGQLDVAREVVPHRAQSSGSRSRATRRIRRACGTTG